MRHRRAEQGQALVETAIVMPVMLLAAMGALQLMFLQHARVLTEYAAFNACRAGIVHHGDRAIMKNAALISVLPLFGRTDSFIELGKTYLRAKFMQVMTGGADSIVEDLSDLLGELTGLPVNIEALAPDVSLVNVAIINPETSDFSEGVEEIEFDHVLDPEHSRNNLLVIEARVLVPLRIPVINAIVFRLWLVNQLIQQPDAFRTDLLHQAAFETQVESGQDATTLREYLEEREDWASALGGSGGNMEQRVRFASEIWLIRKLASQGVYLIPVYTSAAMPMQSNLFRRHLRTPLLDAGVNLGGMP